MKNKIFIRCLLIVLAITFFPDISKSNNISIEQAKIIAESIFNNILSEKSSNEPLKNLIKRIDIIRHDEKLIGYVIYFKPCGYVIITGFREMIPIFSISEKGKYSSDYDTIESILKPALIQKYQDFKDHLVSQNAIERNQRLWDKYLKNYP